MARATSGTQAAFTYDFGINIAQSTVNKLTRLTGATLTLASAFYALKQISTEYVSTLKENALRFGGYLSTINAMEQAQTRLLKGLTSFKVDDQLKGMNQLMAAGVNAGKNFEFVNKAAHAMGQSFTDFSSAIAQGIAGNMSGLVQMGLLTQRATRMFEKYEGNTVMREAAIMNFMRKHKGLQNLIKNDFATIQDQVIRLKESWRIFLQSIMGKPNDKNSFYGQIVASVKLVADAFSRNTEYIKRKAFVIGQVLGWMVKQVAHSILWFGKQIKGMLHATTKAQDDYRLKAYNLVLWLEFWKLKLVSVFTRYKWLIKDLIIAILVFKGLKSAFVIGELAFVSIRRYKRAFLGLMALQSRYRAATGANWLMSMAAWMPKWMRRFWISMGKSLANFGLLFGRILKVKGLQGFGKAFTSLFPGMAKVGKFFAGFGRIFTAMGRSLKLIFSVLRNLPQILAAAWRYGKLLWVALNATNPVGWIILAISAFVLLYTKVKWYRDWVNSYFKMVWEYIKLFGAALSWVYVQARIIFIKMGRWIKKTIFDPIKGWFSAIGDYIGKIWAKVKDTTVGKWITSLGKGIKSVFDFVGNLFKGILGIPGKIAEAFSKARKVVAEDARKDAAAYGFSAPFTGNGTQRVTTPTKPVTPVIAPTGTKPKNPLAPQVVTPDTSEDYQTMYFQNGAIQIIVQKGENIDEDKLTKKIKEAILDLQRESKVRGGN